MSRTGLRPYGQSPRPCHTAFHPGRRRPRGSCASSGALHAPVFSRNGPPLVIAPTPADFQIPRRKAFQAKPETSDQFTGGDVTGLNIGLHAMQTMARKEVG